MIWNKNNFLTKLRKGENTMKVFVLRTEAILASEDAPIRFDGDNMVVIPMAILENLYRYDGLTEKKKIASDFCEYISSFNQKELLSQKGAKQQNGSMIRVVDNRHIYEKIENTNNLTQLDKRVFQVCLDLQEEEDQVILISQNPVIRIKAFELGIKAEPFKDEIFPKPEDQFTGHVNVYTSQTELNKLFREGYVPIKSMYDYNKIDWIENLFVNIKTESSSALGRYTDGRIVPLEYSQKLPNGYKALNAEQKMLWECLMAPPEIAPLVVVKGAAGTGKTFCSLAYALEHVRKFSSGDLYNQILVGTPVEYGEKIGYLPGDISAKISPLLGGIYDNLKSIFREKNPDLSNMEINDQCDEIFERGYIEIQVIGFLRGRTIPYTCFIIDETQNVKPDIIKNIVTRAAKGSKFIFLGDPNQIGNPDLNSRYNGLVYLSEKLKGNSLCWQVTLSSEKSVRSELAQVALNVLN